jgi:hypothetical protein
LLTAIGDNGAMEAEPPKRKRRWFQFSLRTLMIVVTLLAVACAYVGWQEKIVRERQAWKDNPKFYVEMGQQVPSNLPWIRRLLGDSDCMWIIADDSVSDAELDACRLAFPDVSVLRDRDQPVMTGRRVEIHFRNGQYSEHGYLN